MLKLRVIAIVSLLLIAVAVGSSCSEAKYPRYNASWFYEPPVTEEEAGRLWDSWLGSNMYDIKTDNFEEFGQEFLVRKKEGKYEIVDSLTNMSSMSSDDFEDIKSGLYDNNFKMYTCEWTRDFSPDFTVDYVLTVSQESWDSHSYVRKTEGEKCGDEVRYMSSESQLDSINDSIDIYYSMTDKNQDKINNVPAADFDITIFGMDDEILFEQSYKLTPNQDARWTTVLGVLKHAGYVISIDRSKISNPTSNSTGKLRTKITTYDSTSWDLSSGAISDLPTNTATGTSN